MYLNNSAINNIDFLIVIDNDFKSGSKKILEYFIKVDYIILLDNINKIVGYSED